LTNSEEATILRVKEGVRRKSRGNVSSLICYPDINAGCPMADMVAAERLRRRKEEIPTATVVCYIDSSAEVKSESDVCCTSANVVKVIESLDTREILFVPDQYLGHYISAKTDKKMVLWPGFCPTHIKIHPHIKILVIGGEV